MNPTEDRITDILREQFRIPATAFVPGVTFKDLKLDSLVLIELTLILETEFDIAIADGALTDDLTIADAAEVLSRCTEPIG